MPDVDARILRLEQGVVTVLLLAGFVFSISWLIPTAALFTGMDAAFGPAGPTEALWRGLIAPRLGATKTLERRAAGRAQELVVFGALVAATLLTLIGLDSIATILAILVAGVSAAAATGLFSVGAELDRRNQPRPRP